MPVSKKKSKKHRTDREPAKQTPAWQERGKSTVVNRGGPAVQGRRYAFRRS